MEGKGLMLLRIPIFLAVRTTASGPTEMHSRAAGTTVYEMAHDATRYPLEAILAMAESAASRKADLVPKLREGLKHSDSAVRSWAATGFLVRGSEAVAKANDALREALGDPSPSVRAIAAWALGRYGGPADLDAALPVLRALAPPEQNGVYISMLALNAIDALGPKASSLHDFIRAMRPEDPKAPDRVNEYVPRLQAKILGEPRQPPKRNPKSSPKRSPGAKAGK